MRLSKSKLTRRTQRGVAAVEMALVLPILATLLAVPLFLGRVFWHYTAAQKAAHDAVRYLSSASAYEMTSLQLVGGREVPVAALAREIAAIETAQLNPGRRRHAITVQCDGIDCNGISVPRIVRVHVSMQMYDVFLGSFSAGTIPALEGITLTADVSMRHVGR
jgi:hypothetical protein